jgi:hypothetical protein
MPGATSLPSIILYEMFAGLHPSGVDIDRHHPGDRVQRPAVMAAGPAAAALLHHVI